MSSQPNELEKYVKWHSRRIAALEEKMGELDPSFTPASRKFGRAPRPAEAPVDRVALLHRVATSTEERAAEVGRPSVAAPVGELHREEATAPSAAVAGEAPVPTASPATEVVAGEQRTDTTPPAPLEQLEAPEPVVSSVPEQAVTSELRATVLAEEPVPLVEAVEPAHEPQSIEVIPSPLPEAPAESAKFVVSDASRKVVVPDVPFNTVKESPEPAEKKPLRSPTASEGFMTPEEAAGLPAINWSEEEPERSIEETIGTKWLIRAGGVLLIVGAVIGARMVTPRLGPEMKFALAMVFSALVGGAGWFVERRNKLAGRTTMVIGFALAYFASFASHFLVKPPVFQSLLIPVTLMFSLAGLKVWLANRWRSEFVTIFGVALGTLSALLAAPQSGTFTLLALGILAGAAGILLIKNEWFRLTGLTLVGIYASLAIFWHIVPVTGGATGVLMNMAAVLIYHIMFTLAFWRWSRPWIAREQLADDPDELMAPRIDRMRIPYGSGFAILNSLGLIGLTLWLCYSTQVLWSKVEWLLAGLALMEVARLLVPALRPKIVAPFHLLSATILGTLALVAALNTDILLTALAAETLILVIAASLSPSLKWLRIIAIFPAVLAVQAALPIFGGMAARFTTPAGVTTAGQTAANILAGVLFLASALPWAKLLRRREERELGEAGEFFAGFVAHAVALFGTAVTLSSIVIAATSGNALLLGVAAFAVAVVVGRALMGATTWSSSSIAAMLAFTFLIFASTVSGSGVTMAAAAVSILLVILALELWAFTAHAAFRFGVIALAAVVSTASAIAFGLHASGEQPYSALWMVAMSVAAIIINVVGSGRVFPALLGQRSEEGDHATPGLILGAIFLAGALVLALVIDARVSLISPIILSAISFTLWGAMRKRVATWLHQAWFAATYAMMMAAIFINMADTADAFAAMTGLSFTALLLGLIFSQRIPFIGGAISLPIFALAMVMQAGPHQGLLCVVTTVLVGAGSIIIHRHAKRCTYDGDEDAVARSIAIMNTVTAGVVGLVGMRVLHLVYAPYTVLAGAQAAAMLVAGFATRHKTMRLVGLGTLAFAMGHIVFVDLAGADDWTKLLGTLGIGVLAIVSGLGYSVASKRLAEVEK